MFRCALIAAAVVACAATSLADVTIIPDLLGPEDGISLPPPGSGLAIVDVLVDVTDGDSWTAGGIRAFAMNGATLRYATDPSSGERVWGNPGHDNRFVTFISEPRARDADNRYDDGGALSAGRWPHGPTHTLADTEVGITFFASPPESMGSPTVDGAIVRIALDVPGGREAFLQVVPLDEVPSGSVVYLTSTGPGLPPGYGTASTTFDNPTFVGIDWALIDPVPEPATVGVLLAGLALWRRR